MLWELLLFDHKNHKVPLSKTFCSILARMSFKWTFFAKKTYLVLHFAQAEQDSLLLRKEDLQKQNLTYEALSEMESNDKTKSLSILSLDNVVNTINDPKYFISDMGVDSI